MHYVATFADLLSAVFGTIAALILAVPLFGEVTDRRHWQRLAQFRSIQSGISKSDAELAAEQKLREQMIDERLGEYETYRLITFAGAACLLIAFVFLGIAGAERAFSTPCTS